MEVFKNGLDAQYYVSKKVGKRVSFAPVCAFGIISSGYTDLNTDTEKHVCDLVYCDSDGNKHNGGGFGYHYGVEFKVKVK